MSTTLVPPDSLSDLPRLLAELADSEIQRPLWEWAPEARKAVIHERRRRFGWNDGEGPEDG